jgi:hypothetical protein
MRKGEWGNLSPTYPYNMETGGCLRIQFWVKGLGIRENKSIYSEEFINEIFT